jgi:hypothetical protein
MTQHKLANQHITINVCLLLQLFDVVYGAIENALKV